MALRDVWVLVGSRRVRADLVEIVEARRGGLALRVAGERQPLVVALGGAASAAMGEREAMVQADMLLAAMSVAAQLPHGALVIHVDGDVRPVGRIGAVVVPGAELAAPSTADP